MLKKLQTVKQNFLINNIVFFYLFIVNSFYICAVSWKQTLKKYDKYKLPVINEK